MHDRVSAKLSDASAHTLIRLKHSELLISPVVVAQKVVTELTTKHFAECVNTVRSGVNVVVLRLTPMGERRAAMEHTRGLMGDRWDEQKEANNIRYEYYGESND